MLPLVIDYALPPKMQTKELVDIIQYYTDDLIFLIILLKMASEKIFGSNILENVIIIFLWKTMLTILKSLPLSGVLLNNIVLKTLIMD